MKKRHRKAMSTVSALLTAHRIDDYQGVEAIFEEMSPKDFRIALGVALGLVVDAWDALEEELDWSFPEYIQEYALRAQFDEDSHDL